jgi:2-methylisocitrate lyase-like PEP mutase family enzyme
MNNKKIKQLLSKGNTLLAPGVYDALSALIAEQTGFSAVYLSGASIAYTRLGRSDVGLTTYSEVENVLNNISSRVSLPIIVDADTGFGNALNVQRTVRGFERAGAAMIQIEDQSFPKRCGHLSGKTVISKNEMCGKLRAALDARHNSNTLILARTDALATESFDETMQRAQAYFECGVDALFIEALQTSEQMKKTCDLFAKQIPLLANMIEGGKTPLLSMDELTNLGFRIVIFPGGTVRALAFSLQDYYKSLFASGTNKPHLDSMLNFDQLNTLIETPELLDLAKQYEK